MLCLCDPWRGGQSLRVCSLRCPPWHWCPAFTEQLLSPGMRTEEQLRDFQGLLTSHCGTCVDVVLIWRKVAAWAMDMTY